MSERTPRGWFQPASGSLLARLLARGRRHPDEFDAAVRVVTGTLDGEGARFRYRRSALDALVVDGAQEFTHGDTRMRVIVEPGPALGGGAGVRPAHVVWRAHVTGAVIEIAADPDVALRFGVALD